MDGHRRNLPSYRLMDWDGRIDERLKLKGLRALLAVTQAGSMARGAKQLSLSQPAISKAITEMEGVLGVPLLERGPHGVLPTRYGQALIARSLAALDELRQGVNDIAYLKDPTVGEIRIGTTEPLSLGIVAAAIEKLSERYPGITFQLVVADIRSLHESLQDRQVEVAVSQIVGPWENTPLKVDILYEDAFVVVAGNTSQWARQRKIGLADLADAPWVLPNETFVQSFVARAFSSSGLKAPKVAISTRSLSLRLRLLCTDRFVSAVSQSLLRFSDAYPHIKELPIQLATTRIGIATLPGKMLSPVAELFIATMQELADSGGRRRPVKLKLQC